jgi:hypothetical protein
MSGLTSRRETMTTRRARAGLPQLVAVLGATVLLAFSAAAGSGAAVSASRKPHLAGTWSGKYSGAYSGTFRLHWTQSGQKLRGSITLSKPHGTYGVTGRVRGASISFGAVGVGATYAGSVSGTSMSGTYRTSAGGGSWSAHRAT